MIVYKHLLAIALFTTMTTFSPEPKINNSGRISPVCATALQQLKKQMSKRPNNNNEHRNKIWEEDILRGTATDCDCKKISFWVSQKK
jgi:hypothetical protein